MKLYPAIDLHEGKCVRLYQGDYGAVTEYGNPVETALKWKSMGASFLHLVDLDGAKAGSLVNKEAVRRIIKEVGIDCELGGGIRTISQIEDLLSLGVKRVILGSAALDLAFVREAVLKFGADKIVIGIDCKNMRVATHGWLNVTDISAVDFALKLKTLGIQTVIFTDIAKDGTMEGVNLLQTKELVDKTGLFVVASGGAKNLKDIENCKKIGCSGIILGKSIYSGTINLKEAIEEYED